MKNLLFSLFSVLVITFSLPTSCSLPLEETRYRIPTISLKELETLSPEAIASLKKAVADGCFYLEIPQNLRPLVSQALSYGREFYKDAHITTTELPWTSGYYGNEHMQAETFVCQEPYWQRMYPKTIQLLATKLNTLSLELLKTLLSQVVPELAQERWSEATGSLLEGKGTYFFSYNHYRPEKKLIGQATHKDLGYLTLLYFDKDGLYARIGGTPVALTRKEGFFVAMIGKAFELLVNDTEKVNAREHFVEQITQETHGGDRVSFAHFCDNAPETPLKQLCNDGSLIELYPSYKDYLVAEVAKIQASQN